VSAVLGEEVGSAPVLPLSELADLVRGVSYPKADAREEPAPGFVPMLRATNIQNARLVLDSDLVFIAKRHVSPDQLLRQGDIVVATSSGSKHLVGKSGQLHAAWHGSFGAFCATVRPRPGIHPRYLALFLQAPAYWRQITKKALGVNINNLRRGDLESLEVPLPSLAVQARIVAEIEKQFSRLDEAAANLKRVKANLKRYKAAALKAAVEGRLVPTEAEVARRERRGFEAGETLLQRVLERRRDRWRGKGDYPEPHSPETFDLAPLPEGWAYATAEQLTDENRAITYGVIKLGDPVEGGVPVLRSSNVRSLRIDLADVKSISPSIAANYRRTFLEGGEVVITVRGTLGGVAVVPPPCRGFNVSREVAMLALVEPAMARTVALFIASPAVQRWLMNRTKGIAYTGINIETLKALPIGVPPLKERERIVAEIERRMSISSEVEADVNQSLDRALSLRRAVLEKAFVSMSGVCES
jgi:type I restriction enzyme S subunit